MQGHGAETSIIGALDAVADRAEEFDAAVIIRGGGSQSDLSFLNSYLLSFHIAQFPLPVIAGLGHDKDCLLYTSCEQDVFAVELQDTRHNRITPEKKQIAYLYERV